MRSWQGPPPRRGRSGGWRLLRAATAPSPCTMQTRLLSTPPAAAGDGRSKHRQDPHCGICAVMTVMACSIAALPVAPWAQTVRRADHCVSQWPAKHTGLHIHVSMLLSRTLQAENSSGCSWPTDMPLPGSEERGRTAAPHTQTGTRRASWPAHMKRPSRPAAAWRYSGASRVGTAARRAACAGLLPAARVACPVRRGGSVAGACAAGLVHGEERVACLLGSPEVLRNRVC